MCVFNEQIIYNNQCQKQFDMINKKSVVKISFLKHTMIVIVFILPVSQSFNVTSRPKALRQQKCRQKYFYNQTNLKMTQMGTVKMWPNMITFICEQLHCTSIDNTSIRFIIQSCVHSFTFSRPLLCRGVISCQNSRKNHSA